MNYTVTGTIKHYSFHGCPDCGGHPTEKCVYQTVKAISEEDAIRQVERSFNDWNDDHKWLDGPFVEPQTELDFMLSIKAPSLFAQKPQRAEVVKTPGT